MKETQLEFSDVYEEFHGKISRYLKRMVGEDEAEDLTQEVFVKVSDGLKDFKGESRLYTWIYRIATNAALDRLKSRSFRKDSQAVSLSGSEEQEAAELRDASIQAKSLTAEREAIRKEMTECIREFVDKLPENYRTVIILSELKDLKNQDIADILGTSLDAVKIRLHRARAKLKEVFEAGCTFYEDENDGLACDRKSQESEEGP
ncbi:MAG: RNA polymerase sigma factor [Planctomycetota bacterium]|jgi:RNA polymerase sigma-70 factor (ECF subfamily)